MNQRNVGVGDGGDNVSAYIRMISGISDNSEDEREQDVHTPGEGGLELQGVGMLANVSVCKKKGYNHHARAHFDRARAFALQVPV